jgi:hypothetical protein
MLRHADMDFAHNESNGSCIECTENFERRESQRSTSLLWEGLGELTNQVGELVGLVRELLEQGGTYQRKPYRPYTPPLPLPPPTQPIRSGGLNVKPRIQS